MLKQHNWIDIKLLQNYNKISKVALHRVFYRIIVPNHALQNRVEKVRKFQRMTPEIESFYFSPILLQSIEIFQNCFSQNTTGRLFLKFTVNICEYLIILC